jgi:hypothetical protein
MDGIALNELHQPIWAEEDSATDLYVLDTAMEDVIAQRLRAYSEHLRGSRDIEQALKFLPALR